MRILLLEDVPTDAELAEIALREAGLVFTSRRVDTREAFVLALEEFKPDIVLADYKLPDFDGMSALQMVRRNHPEAPVIIVTGVLPDVEAAELLHAGAKDYVLKDRLARLPAAVQRVLSTEEGIRARKAAERAMRESEERLRLFRKLLDSSADSIEVIDPVTLRFLDINEAGCRELGYSREEVLAMGVTDIDPVFGADTMKLIDEKIKNSGQARIEGVHRRKDGTMFPVEISLRFVEFDKAYVLSIARDITERKQAEEALQKTTADLKEAQHVAHIGSWSWDIPTDTIIWSPEYYRIGRFNPKLPTPNYEEQLKAYTPETAAALDQAVKHTMATGEPYALELEYIKPDVAGEWILARGAAKKDAQGKVVGLYGTAQDITERKRAEQELRDSDEKNRQLFESSRDALMTLAPPSWKFTRANRATLELFGAASEAEYTALGPWDVSPERQPDGRPSSEKAQEMIATAMREGSNFFEWEHKRINGEAFAADVLLTRMEIGEEAFLQATVRDIAERKQTESLLNKQLDELRRWQDATLGREMRILDLKHEVNELLAQSGQPPRYPSAESDDRRPPVV